jgi:hypothetical protein
MVPVRLSIASSASASPGACREVTVCALALIHRIDHIFTDLVPAEAKQSEHFLYSSTQPMICLDNLLTALYGRPTFSIENEDRCDWKLKISSQAKEERSELWVRTMLGMMVPKWNLALDKPDTGQETVNPVI